MPDQPPAGSPELRLKRVLGAARLAPLRPPETVLSYSNDTWLMDDPRLGPVVLRVGWRGDVTRLHREAVVGAHAPAELGYPEVLGHGGIDADGIDHDGAAPDSATPELTWTITRRLTGRPADQIWHELTPRQRRTAAARLAEQLRVLHTWRPPAAVLDALLPRPLTDPADPSATVGADINPLPLTRTLALAPHVADLPHVDAGLVSETTATLAELAPLAPPLDDPTATGLTHGDLHLNNFWWTGTPATGRLSALLDLEWARFAPPWVDLERLALNAHTELTTGADTGTNSRPYLNLIADLRTHYPEPFATDRLPARLRYYAMAQILRQVLVEPPDAPEPELDPDHPLRILHRLLTEGENAWSQVLGR